MTAAERLRTLVEWCEQHPSDDNDDLLRLLDLLPPRREVVDVVVRGGYL